jgi:hypothetical protein
MTPTRFSRRDFLKLAGLGAGALALRPLERILPLAEFPQSELLARNAIGGRIEIRKTPDIYGDVIKTVYEDTVMPWRREVVTKNPDMGRYNQRWVETDEGYVYGAYVQKTRNLPNSPLTALPAGQNGFWAEVTIPYVDMYLEADPASPWAKDLIALQKFPRLYYSQVVWIDQIRTASDGTVQYRFNENGGRPEGVTGGGFGDLFWADGRAFRILTLDELTPISPDVDPADKKVVVNLSYQTVACMEKDKEVYFCRCSAGAKYDFQGNPLDKYSTPIGEYATWRKAISIHMTGGASGAGWDTPAVAWTTLFAAGGVAIHSAFWHNAFGEPKSHGCVNVLPEDAKWIFRWSLPQVPLDVADVTVQMPGGTKIKVEERLF